MEKLLIKQSKGIELRDINPSAFTLISVVSSAIFFFTTNL